jgi:hypothetical protein
MPAVMGASRIPEINANGVHPECNVGVAAIVKPKEIAVVVMVIAVMLKMVIRLYLQVDAGDDAGINHTDVEGVAVVPVAEPSQGNNYYHLF